MQIMKMNFVICNESDTWNNEDVEQHGNAKYVEEVENVEHVAIVHKYDMIGLTDDENNDYEADWMVLA